MTLPIEERLKQLETLGAKRCPFCASAYTELKRLESSPPGLTIWVIHCVECCAYGPVAFAKHKAVQLWNARSEDKNTRPESACSEEE